MASDDPSGPRPAAPIVIRIKLRYDDVEVMVLRFATNVGKSGLFLPTKALQPIGAEIKFELRLADDTPVLVGLGRVKAATAPDPNNPKATFGMAIELMRVTPQSRALILRMLDRRRELGLPELGLPTASDIDAARRAEPVHATARDPVSGAVPLPTAPLEATPSPPPAPGEALLTAPRQTGPITAAKVQTVMPLAPEPPRRKRRAVSEVIESASGPIASVSAVLPGLDDDVDLAAAIVRARALAGSGLDAELEALCEVAAAPLEISIEAASAELARQFGGSAVVRDRSARWAPPPATTISAPSAASLPVAEPASTPAPGRAPAQAPAQGPDQAPAQGPDQAPAQALEQAPHRAPEPAHGWAPEPAHTPELAPVPAPTPEPVEPEDEVGAVRTFAPPNIDQITTEPRSHVSRSRVSRLPSSEDAGDHRAEPRLRATSPEHHEVEPEQIADEIHRLNEVDLEDVEHTEMGEIPIGPGAFEQPGDGSELSSADQARLAARLEAQLAEAEAEADADDLGLAGVAGMPVYGDRDHLGAEPPVDPSHDLDHDASHEEVDEFAILAEADADDADLLAAHGEQEASNSHLIHARAPSIERRASELDFAARLDLDEESDMYIPVSSSEFAAQHVLDSLHEEFEDRHAHDGLHGIFEDERRSPDPHLDSAGQALAALAALPFNETGDEPFGETGDEPFGETGDEPFDETGDEPFGETGDEALDQTGDEPLGEPGDAPPGRPAGLEPKHGVQPIFDPEPSSSYTIAGIPSDSDLDFPPLARPAAVRASQPPRPQPAVSRPEPAILHGPPPPSLHASPMADHELENALEALDVNLDDLAMAHESPRPLPNRDSTKSRPTALIRPAPQAQPPSPQGRVPVPAPSRAVRPAPQAQPPVPQGRAPVPTPSRAVRQASSAVPGSGRVVARPPRMPTDDGVEIEIITDDDDE